MDIDTYVDQIIAHSYNPGYIALSFIVSFAGCWTTLELLHRRTCTSGVYNWYLLIGAATSMGAVAIWCMHYVGNCAIQMLNGEQELQLEYRRSYTAGSFFLPICVLGLAFYYFNQSRAISLQEPILGGIVTGLAVLGMHYTAEVGISNYTISFSWKYILGSAAVAVAANIAALGIFFYVTKVWTNDLLKKLFCASLLAISVSGMHWVATVGTSYRFKRRSSSTRNDLSRQGAAVVVVCLGIGSCFMLHLLAVIGNHSAKRYPDRAKQVVLASATFDQDGKIMVTPGGFLPSQKVTNSYIERTFEDVFAVEHPVFCWVFRASHCWQDVAELIPDVRAHLRAISITNTSPPEKKNKISEMESLVTGDCTDEYSSLFKALFCVAAQDLANLMQQPLEKIGVLFEGVMDTGTAYRAHGPIRKYLHCTSDVQTHLQGNVESHLEAGGTEDPSIVFGRGQLLFVVRRVSRPDSSQIQAAGFRFVSIANVIDTLSQSMAVTKEELSVFLTNLQRHSKKDRLLEPGIHLACFALRPTLHKGFEVVVHRDAKNLLPTQPLPLYQLDGSQQEVLGRMNNWTVAKCCDRLRDLAFYSNEQDLQFGGRFLDCISNLAKQIEKPFFQEARLIARPFLAPCRVPAGSDGLQEHALIIAFRIIIDAHQYTPVNGNFMFTPFRFFLSQQHVYPNSPDHVTFAKRIRREMAALANRTAHRNSQSVIQSYRIALNHPSKAEPNFGRSTTTSPPAKRKRSFPVRPSLSLSSVKDQSITEKEMVGWTPISTFGGISEPNEIIIDSSEGDGEADSPRSTKMRPGIAALEPETFADQLMALTVAERRYQQSSEHSRLR